MTVVPVYQVDYNTASSDGIVTAFAYDERPPGTPVLTTDGEGNACDATVDRYVPLTEPLAHPYEHYTHLAYLRLDYATFDPSPT